MRRMIAWILSACVGVLVFFAVPGSAADRWTSVRSRNFLMIGNGSERSLRDAARRMEQFREAVSRIFPHLARPASNETVFILFNSDNSFRPYKPLSQGKPANIGSLFQGGQDVNYVATAGTGEFPETIYSSYMHAFTRDTLADVPMAIRTGIAELCSSFEPAGKDKFNLGKPPKEDLEYLRAHPMLPLKTLFDATSFAASLNSNDTRRKYFAGAWAFVHYLMIGDESKRKDQFANFLTQLSSGKKTEEALESAFHAGFAEMQRDLEKYVNGRQSWPHLTYDLQDPVQIEKDLKTAALSESEALSYLGDFLRRTGRPADAEKTLQQAVAADSRNPLALGALGTLRLSEKKYDEAVDCLRKAVSLENSNYRTHYDYARAIEQRAASQSERVEDDGLETMRQALKKSIDLNPGFAESYALLAYVYQLRAEDFSESLEYLQKGVKAFPGRVDLRNYLADALTRMNRHEEALAIARPLAGNESIDPRIRSSAARLLEFLERRSGNALEELARLTPPAEPEEVPATVPQPELPETPTARAGDQPPVISKKATETVLEEIPAAPGPDDTVIRRANTLAPPDTVEIRGLLVRLDCVDGATFVINANGQQVRLHSSTPGRVQFTSYTNAVSGSISCGLTKAPGIPVRIHYRKDSASGSSAGEPVLVEFVEP